MTITGCTASSSGPSADNNAPSIVTVRGVEAHIAEGVYSGASAAAIDLERSIRTSLERITGALDSPPTDVYLQADASGAIPEIGVGGRTQLDGTVLIEIDVRHASLEETFGTWLPALLAHELHHSKRSIDGPGYGKTLGEAVISEGLADIFVSEIFTDIPKAPWSNALSDEMMISIAERFTETQHKKNTPTRHRAWFFGTGQLQRWAGYTLGYQIVSDFIEDSGRTAAELAVARARPLLDHWEQQ